MPMIVGIDLGTTYSCLSYIDANGDVQIQPSREGNRTVPSVILFDDDGGITVGDVAKEQADVFPEEQIVELIKRQMGTDYTVDILGNTYKPQTLSAMIVKKLLDDFREQHPDEEIQQVVITCPAYFGTEARNATKEAGLIAGIPADRLSILDEPTAAAISYAAANPGEKTVLVYDLGGGTFDISILKISDSVYTNIATDGNKFLGGKDWDHILADTIKNKIDEEGTVSAEEIENDEEANRRLALDCEDVKKSLSAMTTVKKKLVVGPTAVQYSITRDEFEAATAGKVMESMDIVDRCLAGVNLTIDNIDEIVMVGGSSKMPMIKRALEEKFPGKTIKLSDPDEAIAKGAAIYSYMKIVIGGKADEKEIEELPPAPIPMMEDIAACRRLPGGCDDVIGRIMSKTYGVMCLDDNNKEVISNILFRNMKLPLTVSNVYHPAKDGQRSVKVSIYESEALESTGRESEPSDCENVGEFSLELPAGVKRTDDVHVTFVANSDGLISCQVECLGRTGEKELEVKNAMTDEELVEATSLMMHVV